MKRYVAYIRVSTARQGEHGVSLIEQKSAIEAYAKRNSLAILRWFEERETAAKQGRQIFTKMLSELRAGRAEGVIIHKIDRSARNLRDWADVAELLDRGVDVRFVTDNIDLTSTGGRLSADILAAVAASYVRNLRDEVKKGMWGRLKQGFYPWHAPWGYLDQGGGKIKMIDPVKGPLIRYLFERYGTNTVSLRRLGPEMFDRGLKTATGRALTPASFSIILRNPFYCGITKVRKTGETFPGNHQPLVSRALYERVQQILDDKTVPKARKYRFLFRHLVRCENCGRRTLTGENHKGFTYYRCHGESCHRLSWSQDALEACVLEQIRRVRIDFGGSGDVRDFGDLRDFVRDLYRDAENDRERHKTSLTLRLQQVKVRISKLTDLFIDESIDRDTFNRRKEESLFEQREVEDALIALQDRSPLQAMFEKFERDNRQLLRYESMTDDEKREMLQILGSNFSASRNSPVFTLRTPYREIAEIEQLSDGPPQRNDVRIKAIFEILKHSAENSIHTRYNIPEVPEVPEVPEICDRRPCDAAFSIEPRRERGRAVAKNRRR